MQHHFRGSKPGQAERRAHVDQARRRDPARQRRQRQSGQRRGRDGCDATADKRATA